VRGKGEIGKKNEKMGLDSRKRKGNGVKEIG